VCHRLGLVAIVFLGAAARLPAADWPQWRGPARDGRGNETGLLSEWPDGGPRLAWVTDAVGVGYSGLAVVGDRVYTLGGIDGREHVLALDAGTGKVAWSAPIGPLFKHAYGDGPRSTPTVDGDDVFALGAQGILARLDRATGTVKWSVDFRKELGGLLMRGNFVNADWGYSESPLVDGARVVACPGGKGGVVAAFDRATGKVAWRTAGVPHGATYASVVAARFGGVRQYVAYTGGVEISTGGVMKDPPRLIGVAADTGAVLWEVRPNYTTSVIAPTPVVSGDLVFAGSGYGAGSALYRVTAAEGKFTAERVYATKDFKNYYAGAVLDDGTLYGYSEMVGWVGVDLKTGKSLWDYKTGATAGALVAADGRLYALGDDGRAFLLRPSRTDWDEVGRFDLPAKSKARAANRQIVVCTPPVVANGRLYLRDQERLYCYDVKK